MERLARTKLADSELVSEFVDNGDRYNDVYLPDYARQQALRVFDSDNAPEDLSKVYAVIARACMQDLDFPEAHKKADYALLLNPASAFNHVTLADIYRGREIRKRPLRNAGQLSPAIRNFPRPTTLPGI